jgi:hypothetical protein
MWKEIEDALSQSMNSVLVGIANLLPKFVAFLVVVFIAALIAGLAGFLARRFLRGIDFDETMARWGVFGSRESDTDGAASLLLSRIVSWSVVFLGFLIGIAAFDATLTSRLVGQISAFLPNVAVAVLLLVAGTIGARLLSRTILIGAVNMNLQYARLLSVGAKWLVLVLASAMALNHLGIGGRIVDEAFTILFGGIVLALALAFGLGAKDLVARSLERHTEQSHEETKETVHHF